MKDQNHQLIRCFLQVFCLGVFCMGMVRGSDKMEESETADSHVIHSLHPPVSAGLYGLPYNPILYPPYGYPGYPDTTGPLLRSPYNDRDINVSELYLSVSMNSLNGETGGSSLNSAWIWNMKTFLFHLILPLLVRAT